MRRAGLPAVSRSPDTHVLLTMAWSFFAIAADENDPALGWLVGEEIAEHNLNAGLLRKLETAPSLFQALQRFLRMANEEATHIQLGMHNREADVLIYARYPGMSDLPGYHVAQAYQLGIILGVIRHYLGRHWIPQEIGIEQQVVPARAAELYPGTRIMTRQPMGYIAVPRTCLYIASPHIARQIEIPGELIPDCESEFLDTLRAALRTHLPAGYPPARLAAELMGVSERTLARRLAVHGRTYGELVDEVRFVEARKLLQDARIPINEAAACVGFVDQSNFARMFRRLAGVSPKEFRKLILD